MLLLRILTASVLKKKQSYKNLTLFPLIGPDSITEDYMLLDEALAGGFFRVTEVSEGGRVPELKVFNNADKKVLLLDGEELVGAKQNRVLNTTILVAEKSVIVIPVSCVEQGRWSYRSDEFTSEERMMTYSLRADKVSCVNTSIERDGSYYGDQASVWDGIAAKARRRRVRSPSMAMADIYKHERRSIEEYRRHFVPVAHQIGALFCINGRVAGLDAFGRAETFEKIFSKLLDSYALDAVDWLNGSSAPAGESETHVDTFIAALRSATATDKSAVGLGVDIRFETPAMVGFGLVYEQSMVHLAAFARPTRSNCEHSGSWMRRFSLRRNKE